MNGIDISKWQSGMDLSKVAFDFVWIKATEGIKEVDESYRGFYKQARQLKKLRGVYHYANGEDYKEEILKNYLVFITNSK